MRSAREGSGNHLYTIITMENPDDNNTTIATTTTAVVEMAVPRRRRRPPHHTAKKADRMPPTRAELEARQWQEAHDEVCYRGLGNDAIAVLREMLGRERHVQEDKVDLQRIIEMEQARVEAARLPDWGKRSIIDQLARVWRLLHAHTPRASPESETAVFVEGLGGHQYRWQVVYHWLATAAGR